LVASPLRASGSADYTGDNYPTITVRDGRFVVTFENRVWDREESRWYRTVIDSRGNFVERRVPLAGEDAAQAERLLDGMHGPARTPDDAGTLSVQRGPGGRARPFLVREVPGAAPERIDLSWGAVRIEEVRSLAASPDEVVLVTSPGLFLQRFDRRGTGHPSVNVGKPSEVCMLGCWPRASHVISIGERFAVAWVAQDRSVKLSWWRPKDGRLVTTQLADSSDTNRITIAAIDGAILVAYSEPGMPGAPVPPEGYAVIRYLFLKELPDE